MYVLWFSLQPHPIPRTVISFQMSQHLLHSLTYRNLRWAISHIWQFSHRASLSVWSHGSVWSFYIICKISAFSSSSLDELSVLFIVLNNIVMQSNWGKSYLQIRSFLNCWEPMLFHFWIHQDMCIPCGILCTGFWDLHQIRVKTVKSWLFPIHNTMF